MQFMQVSIFCTAQKLSLVRGLSPVVALVTVALTVGPQPAIAQPTPAAIATFQRYNAGIESRIAAQHRSAATYMAPCTADAQSAALRLRSGELILEHIVPGPGAEADGALLHDWCGTAFAPGAKAADFQRLMRDYENYPQRFAPEVERAKTLAHVGDLYRASVRVRQKHVLTVVLDTEYAIQFGELDAQHGYSISRSTRIAEVASPGTGSEHTLSAKDEHGFLWRLNTYWSYEERDGGLYLQIEAVSLTRSIPTGLGWVVRPFVESIPRESLEFTLRSTMNALRR